MRDKNIPKNTRAFISLLKELNRKELKIIKMRFIEERTLVEVGNYYGVTNQAIKDREDKLIKKIESYFDYSNLQ